MFQFVTIILKQRSVSLQADPQHQGISLFRQEKTPQVMLLGEGQPWYIYKMVAQHMLRTHDVK